MIDVAPLTATIGAEISGVDLADDLDDAVIEEIREALLEWKVLFFRDQHRLDRTSHVAFGRRFGELEIHPITPKDQDQPEVFVIPAGGTFRRPTTGTPTSRGGPSRRSARSSARSSCRRSAATRSGPTWARPTTSSTTTPRQLIDGRKATHDYASAFGAGQPPEVQERMRASTPPSSTRSSAPTPRPGARRST